MNNAISNDAAALVRKLDAAGVCLFVHAPGPGCLMMSPEDVIAFAADPTKRYAAQFGVSEDAVTAFVASFTAAFKASDAAAGDHAGDRSTDPGCPPAKPASTGFYL